MTTIKTILVLSLAFLAILTLANCSGSGNNPTAVAKTPVAETQPLNIVVVTDLSDRLFYEKDQAQRDQTLINGFMDGFAQKLSRAHFRSKDCFRVVVAPQTGSQKSFEYNELIFDPKSGKDRTAPAYSLWRKGFDLGLKNLYAKATSGKTQAQDYPGADVWSYATQSLQYDLKPNYRNVVVFLTDGYVDFEKHEAPLRQGNRANYTSNGGQDLLASLRKTANWQTRYKKENYGLLVSSNKLYNFEAVVVDISPKKAWPHEPELLTTIWTDWLQEMGATKTTVMPRLPIPTLQSQLKTELDL